MADTHISKHLSNAVSDARRSPVDPNPFLGFLKNHATDRQPATGAVMPSGDAGWLSALLAGAIAFVASIAPQWFIYDYWLGGSGLR